MYFGGDGYESLGLALRYTTRRGGLWEEETPLADFHWRDLPLPAGIYTGRTRAELALGLKVIGWEDFPPRMVVSSDDGILKPSPWGCPFSARGQAPGRPLWGMRRATGKRPGPSAEARLAQ